MAVALVGDLEFGSYTTTVCGCGCVWQSCLSQSNTYYRECHLMEQELNIERALCHVHVTINTLTTREIYPSTMLV